MLSHKDYSYGVIPVFKDKEEWKVLLAHQFSHGGEHFWTLPKGHAEGRETPQETALRELKEETGITALTLDPARSYSISYSFSHEGQQIKKEVRFYLGYAMSMDTAPYHPTEISGVRWCTFTEAAELVSHETIASTLRTVAEFLAA